MIDLVKYQQGYGLTPLVQTVFGSTVPDTNTGGDGFWWTNHEPLAGDSLLQAVAVRSVAAGTLTAVVVNAAGVVTARQLFPVVAGVNILPVNNLAVPAGGRVFLNPATGGFRFIAGATDFSFTTASYNNTVGGAVGAVTAQATTIAMAFTFAAVPTLKAVTDGLDLRTASVPLLNYQLGFAATPLIQTVFGSTVPDTSSGGGTSYWTNHAPRSADGLLQSIAVRVVGRGTLKGVIVNAANVVTAQFSFPVAIGINT